MSDRGPFIVSFAPELRYCSVCLSRIEPSQESLLGQYHLKCLPVIEDTPEATTYKTPSGGQIRIGKPKFLHAKKRRRLEKRNAGEKNRP